MIRLNNQGKSLFLLFFLVLLLLLAGCGTSSLVSKNGQSQANETNYKTVEDTKNNSIFKIYYSDDQLLNIVEEIREIQYGSKEELVEAIWRELQSPQNTEYIAIWQNYKLKQIKLDNGAVILDLSTTTLPQLGSSGEVIAVQTLINSLSQIDGIKSIQILIDGKIKETLSGHVSIDKPFVPNEVIYK